MPCCSSVCPLGLHQFVPDSLLSLFDEGELELLLSGVRSYKLEELKKHHARPPLMTGGALPAQTMDWFWAALENFSPEQMARLLQVIIRNVKKNMSVTMLHSK